MLLTHILNGQKTNYSHFHDLDKFFVIAFDAIAYSVAKLNSIELSRIESKAEHICNWRREQKKKTHRMDDGHFPKRWELHFSMFGFMFYEHWA